MATTVIRQSDLPAKLRQSAFAKLFTNSVSPGGVGGDLGLTRQGVHQLISRGRLDAIRIVTDRKPHKLLALVITQESIDNYRATRYQRQSA